MVISVRNPKVVRLLITVGLVATLALTLRPASRAYLRGHHGTWLASVIELFLPPADLYATVGRARAQTGSPVSFQLEYRYPGWYAVRGRWPYRPTEKVAGHLRCGARSVPLASEGRVFDRHGAATSLGYYLVEAGEVGRLLECEITLSGPGIEDGGGIEISRSSGL